MSVKMTKKGILSADSICESSGMNLVIESDRNKSLQYTPNTGANSTLEAFTVDYSNCKAGETVFAKMDI